MINKIIKYFLENRVITTILLILIVVWGISTAPFNWHGGVIPSDPIPVDAIPNIGENQQIVATEWMGRSPKDIQDQITYPLTTALLGTPGVKTIRSSSMFGMSIIYVIFDEDVEFYWSRSRILEKLSSLPGGVLPEGVVPTLGPDATALGQIYWYTLEGRDPKTGKPNGGWDPSELRTIQDFQVKYALASALGVSEVASIGGYVKEYQVDVNPDKMRAFNISLMDIMSAIQKSNKDIGAETLEINKVEYLVRGLGYIQSIEDLEESVITVLEGTPIKVKDVGFVTLGPAPRRGGLDKEGVEAVGGVVVARYGSNPKEVINNVKAKIEEVEKSLPQKELADGSISKVSIVPFYDRSGLIQETIGTLESALSHEVLICIIVVIVLVFNLRASIIISSILPIAVLATFILMRYTGIEANIVALSGIAIAIGVMVDVGVVFVENILRRMDEAPNKDALKGKAFINVIYEGVREVSGALSTAMLTTIVSFLPVFAMQAQEGKLFKPLAYTKTYALGAAFVIGLVILPTIAYFVLSLRIKSSRVKQLANVGLIVLGVVLSIIFGDVVALALVLFGVNNLLASKYPSTKWYNYVTVAIAALVAMYYLTFEWLPLGANASTFLNLTFVFGSITLIIALLWVLVIYYERILRWCLNHRWKFMLIPTGTVLFGLTIWIGFNSTFGFIAKGFETVGWKDFRQTSFWSAASERFPGIGEEFMPSLNEGSFLLMPMTMPHTGIEQNLEMIALLDKRIQNIPEVEITVGKWGRVNSALDPAPTQMFENTINYYSEYILNDEGSRIRFKVDKNGAFELIDGSTYNPDKDTFRVIPKDSLITSKRGKYFRQWRPHIKKPTDIWQEIVNVSHMPGLTASPMLQPIEARLVMLSTGMRAPIGLKVSGPNLEAIEAGGKALEKALKEIPSVIPSTVYYDRAVGAPYLEIKLDRKRMARYGITVDDLQEIISAAVGGMPLTTTVEGRERFGVRLRYPRELRENPDEIGNIIIPTNIGSQIPLKEVAEIGYAKGAQMIQSENTFLIGYVIFDKVANKAEVDVVKEADKFLKAKITSGELVLPDNVSYTFAGNYEQQAKATERLLIVVPLSLLVILLILYFQFKTVTASFIHFSGVIVAFAGGFILLWLYGEPWFMNFEIGGTNMRDLFQMHNINLSIAVWVGFIALFGISTNDGVLMGTYIHDTFERLQPNTKDDIREAVVYAGKKRVRPAAMTTATTLIALLPVLTSTGKGADIMVPMAIPTFGGMLIQSMTMFVVPVFQCWWREAILKREQKKALKEESYEEN